MAFTIAESAHVDLTEHTVTIDGTDFPYLLADEPVVHNAESDVSNPDLHRARCWRCHREPMVHALGLGTMNDDTADILTINVYGPPFTEQELGPPTETWELPADD